MEEVRLEAVAWSFSYTFLSDAAVTLFMLHMLHFIFFQKVSYSAPGVTRLHEVMFTILNRKVHSSA